MTGLASAQFPMRRPPPTTNRQATSPPPLPSSNVASVRIATVIAAVCGAALLIVIVLFLIWPPNAARIQSEAMVTPQASPLSTDTNHVGAGAATKGGTANGLNDVSITAHGESAPTHALGTRQEDDNTGINGQVEALVDTGREVEERAPAAKDADRDNTEVNSFLTLGKPNTLSKPHTQEESASKSEAAFFGVEAKGKRFVYVVDVSSSMSGVKFEEARTELIDSIDALGKDQYFFVAFFNDVPYYQPVDKLLFASVANKKRIKDWITRALPSGGTSPLEAVEHAIRLRPDSVFLLSDGEFGAAEVANIKNANVDFQIPIHTIGFQTNAQTLKQIAEENKGTYRFVP